MALLLTNDDEQHEEMGEQSIFKYFFIIRSFKRLMMEEVDEAFLLADDIDKKP